MHHGCVFKQTICMPHAVFSGRTSAEVLCVTLDITLVGRTEMVEKVG